MYVLTRTSFDAGGSKVEPLVWVGFGLKRDRVVDRWWRTVLFAYTTVIKVTTSLDNRRRRKCVIQERTTEITVLINKYTKV